MLYVNVYNFVIVVYKRCSTCPPSLESEIISIDIILSDGLDVVVQCHGHRDHWP